ncbi:MAG: hypothetical protein WB952_12130 [Terriglobales bacterium]
MSRLPYTNLRVSIPAPEFLDGIRSALNHNRAGHASFLLGDFRTNGWWYYFFVALVVKTPIAFLILLALGTYVCLRERHRPIYLMPLAFTLGILLPSMRSHIDIGIRHVEPVYIGFSVISALGFRQLVQWVRTGFASAITAGTLIVWLTLSVAVHHPDYLAYFNAFAGKMPETILVDSNYDWGQDLKLLGKRLHQLGVKEFALASATDAGLSIAERHDFLEVWYGLPVINDLDICTPAPGWNVISTTVEQLASRRPGDRFYRGSKTSKPWYEKMTPDERVGPLLLYNIPSGMKLSGENCHSSLAQESMQGQLAHAGE